MHRPAAALETPQLVCRALVVIEQHQLGGPLVNALHQPFLEREVEDVDSTALQRRQVVQRGDLAMAHPDVLTLALKVQPGRQCGTKAVRALAVVDHQGVGIGLGRLNGQAGERGKKASGHGVRWCQQAPVGSNPSWYGRARPAPASFRSNPGFVPGTHRLAPALPTNLSTGNVDNLRPRPNLLHKRTHLALKYDIALQHFYFWFPLPCRSRPHDAFTLPNSSPDSVSVSMWTRTRRFTRPTS